MNSKYKLMRNKVTRELRRAKESYFQKINPKKPKEFWRAINYLSKQQSSIADEDGNEALFGSQKADMLSKFFAICFNHLSTPLNDWSESDFNLPVDPPDELPSL